MSKDVTLENIGKILGTGFHKDAIHIAVAPVEAGQTLSPGQRIQITHIGGKAMAWDADDEKNDGIVDPFLQRSVEDGETFFIFLTPGDDWERRVDDWHARYVAAGGEPMW